MDNDNAPFMDAILEHPDDDGPRLVYADWLEEQGNPRGEFIRIQCELAKWPHSDHCLPSNHCVHCPDPPRHEILRRRERDLLDGLDVIGWLSPWPSLLLGLDALVRRRVNDHTRLVVGSYKRRADDHVAAEFRFRRGFVEEVAMTTEQFFGGPCRRCNGGLWRRGFESSDGYCPACRGAGHIEGLVAALFTTTPVTEVRLSDREPERGRDDRWRWLYAAHGLPTAADLPLDLLVLTPQDRAAGWVAWRFDPDRGCWVNEWTIREGALSALSVALVKFGRGLSPTSKLIKQESDFA